MDKDHQRQGLELDARFQQGLELMLHVVMFSFNKDSHPALKEKRKKKHEVFFYPYAFSRCSIFLQVLTGAAEGKDQLGKWGKIGISCKHFNALY